MASGRKQFLGQLGSGLLFAGLPAINNISSFIGSGIDRKDFEGGDAHDEKFWNRIRRKYYPVAKDYINLENGYFGVQAKPVLEAFQKNTAHVNTHLARYARKEYPAIAGEVKKNLAEFLGVLPEEIIITRNATEALNIAIQGYPFQPGDEVVVNPLDYFSMIETFRMLEKRGTIKVREISLPLRPQSEEEIVEVYRQAITPSTRVILLTHVSNINGLIIPVSKITALASSKGIDTITDSAHALGHIPFALSSLGSDFVGMNLHKWIGNPIGAGVLYIKKSRIAAMKPLFGDVNAAADNISKLGHFGTTPLAVTITIPDSLSFHKLLGAEKISARVRYLNSIWMEECGNIKEVELVTPQQVALSAGIASFRISNTQSSIVADYLLKQHGVFTVARSLGENGCIRVTPSVYNSVEDVRKLSQAIRAFVERTIDHRP